MIEDKPNYDSLYGIASIIGYFKLHVFKLSAGLLKFFSFKHTSIGLSQVEQLNQKSLRSRTT